MFVLCFTPGLFYSRPIFYLYHNFKCENVCTISFGFTPETVRIGVWMLNGKKKAHLGLGTKS